MKKNHLLLLLAILLPASLFAHEGTKGGVVDADKVIQKSEKGKKFFEEYQVLIKSRQEEIKAMVDKFTNTQKDLQAKAASLSADKAGEMRANLASLKTDIDRKREDAQRETDAVLQERLDQFRKELVPLIRQVSQELNLDMVINFTPQSGIVHISEKIDITDAVIKKYDAMQ